MAEKPNFLLGKGERLTEPVSMPGRRQSPRRTPYTFGQAKRRVLPMVTRTADAMAHLPDLACPHDEGIGAITLHPEYIAKSYYPAGLLRHVGLRTVGSRPRLITPERRSKGREPEETITTQIFVAGQRRNFTEWAQGLGQWTEQTDGAVELPALENVSYLSPDERVKPIHTDAKELLFEVVLHATEFQEDNYILESFEAYLESLGLTADLDSRLYAGSLCFMRLEAPRERIREVAEFSFLRVAREMPKLRVMRPIVRSRGRAAQVATLPTESAIDTSVRVAVFDGGLPDVTPLAHWVRSFDAPGAGAPVEDHLWHGQAVTSALLFGSLTAGAEAERPFAPVDHYRVIDEQSEDNPYELYDVLQRIQDALLTTKYDFINISVGPALPVEDDDVHAWTAVLDDHLAEEDALATIAVGNNGESDPSLSLNRIQVPGDCVNGLSIGACNTRGSTWQRASYSAIGPGRSPGIVKPDILAFGGEDTEPYNVLDVGGGTTIVGTSGTSFAAPEALRLGIGVRAHFGQSLSPLAIKSLLIHTSEPSSHPRNEVGWGHAAGELEDIVVCRDGVVRVVYQGELTASKYLRASIPMPTEELTGNVKITATFCFATAVDSAHPGNYTRSGLDVVFRPHEDIRDDDAMHAKSASFFRPAELYPTEDVLRRDAHKWETCLHASVRKRGSSLKNPIFDIHYVSRAEGQADRTPNKIKYALVITVESPRTPDLYDRVVRRYQSILEPLSPTVQVPVRTGR